MTEPIKAKKRNQTPAQLRAEIATLKHQVEAKANMIEGLKDQAYDLNEKINWLQRQLSDAKKESELISRNVSISLDAARDENKRLRDELRASETERANVKIMNSVSIKFIKTLLAYVKESP